MGTRGLWGYVIDGEEKLAYNHFDSYPEGLGVQILEHLRGADLATLQEGARALQLVNDETPPTVEDQARLIGMGVYDNRVSTGAPDEWYALLRNTQGDPDLTLRAGFMEDGHLFAQDSLFCEWGYVIDLDAQTLEVYRGFQQSPPTEGRFAKLPPAGAAYFPIALMRSWPLEKLPTEEQFLEETRETEEV